MISWLCPYCHRRMYSAFDFHEKPCITCLHCQREFINPYYTRPIANSRHSEAVAIRIT